ncbi:GUN4 domain-containing protein [Mastigocoleus testarum]|uniref:GUN4 domain-containing protein n=1 Tax=Mastigocoleus testarum TaxID=996925 RepID=UPI0007C7DA14|nr:GUN4 domain-containing protein [Mastigocoleus testarum]
MQRDIQLDGKSRKQFHDALLSAFPSKANLEQMVSFELNENLDTIATGGSYSEVVFKLIEWSEARGKVENLLDAARSSNPGNPKLQGFAQQIWGKKFANTQRPKQEEDNLSSEQGINYIHLQYLLKAGKWKEADKETQAVMLQATVREKEAWLDIESIQNFPCTDLCTIDRLWLKYSGGRFGFSVQKRIWESLGGNSNANYETWCKFGDQLGWRIKDNWLNYIYHQFNLKQSPGHLPMKYLPMSTDYLPLQFNLFFLHPLSYKEDAIPRFSLFTDRIAACNRKK